MEQQYSNKSRFIAAGVFLLFLLLSASFYAPSGATGEQVSGAASDTVTGFTPSETYRIEATLDTERHLLSAKARIVWVNTSPQPASAMYINLYPNAYANAKTLFSGGRIPAEESVTRVSVHGITVNGIPVTPSYVPISANNHWDSTVALIPLPKAAGRGDTVTVDADYSFPVPVASGRMGRNSAGTFYLLAQWFPKVGVYSDGRWTCYHYHPFAEFHSSFAAYDVTVHVPQGFTAAAPGLQAVSGGAYRFRLPAARDFAFAVFLSGSSFISTPVTTAGQKIQLRLLLQPSNAGKKQRYISAATRAFQWLGARFGSYPYQDFVLVDVPGSASSVASMEYPGLVTVRSLPYSPASTLMPESVIIHEIVHQYFYGLLASNEAAEPWLDEGFAEYLTARILEETTPERKAYFNLFGYYPIKGLLFLDLQQIPLIYTLTDVQVPVRAEGMRLFLEYGRYGALGDSAYNYGLQSVYGAVAYTKASLFLQMLERYAGKERFDSVLSRYAREFRFRHPTAEDFFALLERRVPGSRELIGAYFQEAGLLDNEVLKVHAQPGGSTAVVYIRSSRKSVLPLDVALYSTNDTLVKQILPNGSVQKIEFSPSGYVLGAEVDPDRKELFDVNFANNSYLIQAAYGGSLYISVQWFFWVQNLLLIFGGFS